MIEDVRDFGEEIIELTQRVEILESCVDALAYKLNVVIEHINKLEEENGNTMS